MEFCPNELFELLLDCWQINLIYRPTFDEIVDRIENLIENKRSELKKDVKCKVTYLDYPVQNYYCRNKINDLTRQLLTELPFYCPAKLDRNDVDQSI